MTQKFLQNLKGILKPNADDRFINFDGTPWGSHGIGRFMARPAFIGSASLVATVSTLMGSLTHNPHFISNLLLTVSGAVAANALSPLLDKLAGDRAMDVIDKQGRLGDTPSLSAMQNAQVKAARISFLCMIPITAVLHPVINTIPHMIAPLSSALLGFMCKGMWHEHAAGKLGAEGRMPARKWTACSPPNLRQEQKVPLSKRTALEFTPL